MDAAAPPHLDLSRVPSKFVSMLLHSMSLSDRFTCALVCKAWAEAATAATSSIVLRRTVQDLSCLQCWLEKHGGQVEVLQLHACDGAVLTALPCPQLQVLLLRGSRLSISSSVWHSIAAATKLTSVTLRFVQTTSQQADVVSALTALPDLEQLTWTSVECAGQRGLTDSMLLQKLTKLTALRLDYAEAAAAAVEHLSLLTRLQHLSLDVTKDWAAAGCPGLQQLKALTRLALTDSKNWEGFRDVPDRVSELTALQRFDLPRATTTALNKLSALAGLTQIQLELGLKDVSPGSPPLQLPGLQHLYVGDGGFGIMPMSFLASCTQLRVLSLCTISLSPGSLAASTMLQYLNLCCCRASAADEAAEPVSWQQVFPGPGGLPHLTSLQMISLEPDLQHADIQSVAACCSSLKDLYCDTLPDSCFSALTCLSGLTTLTLAETSDEQCSSLAQLTGLRELIVEDASQVFAAGLRQLAALEQLTVLELTAFLGPSNEMCDSLIINTVSVRVLRSIGANMHHTHA